MTISRRNFVVRGTAAGAGLIIAVRFNLPFAAAQENERAAKKPAPNPFDAWIHVKPDGKISLIVAKSEMGQGIRTGLAMLLAEEAEVELNAVKVEQAEAAEAGAKANLQRSEERRVGKECRRLCRSRWSPYH